MAVSAPSATLAQPVAVVRPSAGLGPSRNVAATAASPGPTAPVSSKQAARPADPVRATPKLTPEQEARVRELQRLDAEVRAHERAHAAAGGRYAGPPQYETTRGPDGRMYAVNGSVAIDVTPVPGDPAATIEKMEVVKRAALAPAEPSAQDRRVAQKAEQLKLQAQSELRAEKTAARRAAADEVGDAATPSLMRRAASLYERAAQAFAPDAVPVRTLAVA